MIKDLFYLFFPKPLVNINSNEEVPDRSSWTTRKHRFYLTSKRKIRKYKKSLYTPICYVLGHSEYKDNYWSYSRVYCYRCNYMKSLWESSNGKSSNRTR